MSLNSLRVKDFVQPKLFKFDLNYDLCLRLGVFSGSKIYKITPTDISSGQGRCFLHNRDVLHHCKDMPD